MRTAKIYRLLVACPLNGYGAIMPESSNIGGFLMASGSRLVFCVLAVTSLTSLATAQWSYVDLHPSTANSSVGFSIAPGYVVGSINGASRAVIWTGGNVIDVTPAVATSGELFDTNGAESCGYVVMNGQYVAGRWFGATPTFQSLAPKKSVESQALGLYNNRQVGYYRLNRSQYPSAVIWSSTPLSAVNIHPNGWNEGSIAYSIFNDVQVGAAAQGAFPGAHACRWINTRNSFLDLHPPGFDGSLAQDVYGSTIVGMAYFRDINTGVISGRNAFLWSALGGPGSNFHPAGWTQSQISGVYIGAAVGRVWDVNGVQNAFFWDLYTSATVNLHSVLPPGVYSSSAALKVWTDGFRHIVSGVARDAITGNNHNVVWMYDIPV
jgi:hypothetical protein